MSNPEDDLKQRDEAHRQRMRVYAEGGNEKAQAWLEKDQQAAQANAEADVLGQKIDFASMSLAEVEHSLQEARDRRDEHLQGGAPNVFEGDKRKEWIATRDRLNGEVNEYQIAFAKSAESAGPEEIAALQKQMQERSATAQEAEEQRRGLYLLPSEREAEAKKTTLQSRVENLGNDWSPDQGQSADSSQVARGQMRTARGYEGYAASAQSELDLEKETQVRVNTYLQNNLGKGQPTMEQLDQWEAQQSAEQSKSGAAAVPQQSVEDARRYRGASQEL